MSHRHHTGHRHRRFHRPTPGTVEVDQHGVEIRPLTTSAHMARIRGGGHEILRNGRRCWVLVRSVVVDLIDVLVIEPDRLDEVAA